MASNNTPPPPPPPKPENPQSKISPFVQKLRSEPPNYYYQAPSPSPLADPFDAPTGPYFFYGTLIDPSILREVLGLDPAETEERKADFDIRPAHIIGYECKLWGQYPALLDASGSVVEGAVFRVRTVQEGGRLAAYETRNYRTVSCRIHYTDGKEPEDDIGYVFQFVGDQRELSEGKFDLRVWLRRMGRGAVVDGLDARNAPSAT